MKSIQFLQQNGKMSALIAAKDWENTSLGCPDQWPQSLRTTLSIMLASRFPMSFYWGPQLIFFYNDAFRPSLGYEGRHPFVLGMPAREAWPDIWPIIEPFFTEVLTFGKSLWNEDVLIPMLRNSRKEDAYFTFSYSPVPDESGRTAGVFVTSFETTEKVVTLQETKRREEELQFIIDAADLGTWDFNPENGTFVASKRIKKWFGLPDKKELELSKALEVIEPSDRIRLMDAIQETVTHAAAAKFDITFSILPVNGNKQRTLRASGKAYFNGNDVASRFNGTLEDITQAVEQQQLLKESEKNFRKLIEYSPVAMSVLHGNRFVVGITNAAMLNIWGRTLQQVKGKPIFDVLPEASEQGLEEILLNVFKTGERFVANQRAVRLPRGAEVELCYINFVYEPIKDLCGKVYAVIAVAADVTEQVHEQRRIDREKEQMKRTMLKASIDAQENERELISNELHDNVNQLLASTKLFIGLIDTENPKNKYSVERSIEYLDQTIKEIRDLSHGMSPAVLQYIGLTKAVEEMFEKINQCNKIKFSFEHANCTEDSPERRANDLIIFRIIQAQVANIIKHSSASRAEASLVVKGDFLELIIADNGVGFDINKTKKGLGLLNIVNRTELLNGTVSLESKPGKGCTLKVRIPVGCKQLA